MYIHTHAHRRVATFLYHNIIFCIRVATTLTCRYACFIRLSFFFFVVCALLPFTVCVVVMLVSRVRCLCAFLVKFRVHVNSFYCCVLSFSVKDYYARIVYRYAAVVEVSFNGRRNKLIWVELGMHNYDERFFFHLSAIFGTPTVTVIKIEYLKL